MATITKKDLVDKVAEKTKSWQSAVKTIIQHFLDEIVSELAKNSRLESPTSVSLKSESRQQELHRTPRLCRRSRFLQSER